MRRRVKCWNLFYIQKEDSILYFLYFNYNTNSSINKKFVLFSKCVKFIYVYWPWNYYQRRSDKYMTCQINSSLAIQDKARNLRVDWAINSVRIIGRSFYELSIWKQLSATLKVDLDISFGISQDSES